MGNDGFTIDREGGSLGDRDRGGGLEGLCGGGELLDKAERDPT